jgi:hypothetical protein
MKPVKIKGMVVVPDGRTCLLLDTHVKGNVFAYTDVTFTANRARVTGNIQT